MRVSLSIAVAVSLALGGHCLATEIPKFNPTMLVSGDMRKEQRPSYPVEARRHGIQGSGIYILNISAETGRVDSIQIKKSAGDKILDDAAMKALISYRFKPHTVTRVWIPMEFTLRKT
jgi:TonB family protein